MGTPSTVILPFSSMATFAEHPDDTIIEHANTIAMIFLFM
jgi:hypothetical protein